MRTEYEVKVLDIDVPLVEGKICALGGTKVADRLMKRLVYNILPGDNNGLGRKWIRLRFDGEKTSLTIKHITSYEIDGTKELEMMVDDFGKAKEFLETIGFQLKAYQENKRTSYKLGDVMLEIDSWPKIKPYLEIEGPSKESVLNVVDLLEISKNNVTSIGVSEVYAKYGLDIHSYNELRFD